ncbi:MAG: acyl carrier protein [Oligoflexia bacterium]|nr:acyl carrier protein [Oligoflexia bacterium]
MTLTEKEQKLAKFFVEREGDGVLEVIKNIDFFADGIIDSLDMVSLAVYVEKNFGKKLDLTQRSTMDAMKRFDTLMGLIET